MATSSAREKLGRTLPSATKSRAPRPHAPALRPQCASSPASSPWRRSRPASARRASPTPPLTSASCASRTARECAVPNLPGSPEAPRQSPSPRGHRWLGRAAGRACRLARGDARLGSREPAGIPLATAGNPKNTRRRPPAPRAGLYTARSPRVPPPSLTLRRYTVRDNRGNQNATVDPQNPSYDSYIYMFNVCDNVEPDAFPAGPSWSTCETTTGAVSTARG